MKIEKRPRTPTPTPVPYGELKPGELFREDVDGWSAVYVKTKRIGEAVRIGWADEEKIPLDGGHVVFSSGALVVRLQGKLLVR